MQTLKMDFQSQSAPPVVPVMQSDSQSRFIGITLYNGGVAYEAPEGAQYTVQYRGPGANNMGWYDTIQLSSGTRKAVVVDSTHPNVVTLELAEQALRVNGNVFVNLCVVNNTGYKLNTFPILCRVTGAPYVDPVSVRSYFYVTGLTSEQWLAYVTACQDAQKRAEDAAATFETDSTLSISGKAADAKVTGDKIGKLKEDIDNFTEIVNGVNLFNPNDKNIKTHSQITSKGTIQTNPEFKTSLTDFIDIDVSKSKILRSTSNANNNIAEYKSDGTFIKLTTVNSASPITLDDETVRIRIVYYPSLLPVMFYQSDKILPYEDYYVNRIVKEGSIPDRILRDSDLIPIENRFDEQEKLYKDIFGIKNTPNMLNPDTLEKGKVINSEGNVVDGASNRSTSGLIKVDVSLPLKITTTGNQILCQYDSAGNSLVRTTEFSSTTPVTLENNAKYVRVCLWNSTISSAMLYQSEETLSYIPYHVYSEKARDKAYIYATDTEEEIFNKLYNAYLIGDYDVYWEHGTYEFSTIFELLKTKYGRNTAYELPIGGNCRYFFNGSTLKATAVSEDSNVLGNESLLGSWRKSGNYELHDGFLESTGMVYVVHDESSGLSEPYTRKYKNIHMKYTADTSKRPSGFCLGGGTGLNGYVEFDGCVFETNSNSTVDGGFHGHSKDVSSTFNVSVKNCYFSKAFQKGTLATNENANLIFTGCAALIIPSSSDRWNVMQWNNETHS